MIQFEPYFKIKFDSYYQYDPTPTTRTWITISDLVQLLWLISTHNLWLKLTHISILIRTPLHKFDLPFLIWPIISDSILLSFTILFESHCINLTHRLLFDWATPIHFDSAFPILNSLFMIQFYSVLWFYSTPTAHTWLVVSN